MIPRLITLASLALSLSLQARTWTSADGSSEFDGELQSYDKDSGKVIVLIEGKTVNFTADKLSKTDQEFLANWNAPENAATTDEHFTAKLTNKVLSRLSDGKFQPAKLEKKPEYFLLYYSASW